MCAASDCADEDFDCASSDSASVAVAFPLAIRLHNSKEFLPNDCHSHRDLVSVGLDDEVDEHRSGRGNRSSSACIRHTDLPLHSPSAYKSGSAKDLVSSPFLHSPVTEI